MSVITKTIGELKGHRFFVPSYQRGYRWTEYEIRALLDDVSEFSTDGNQRYCIQPLIVKRRDDDSFEVVDGQQRLTTIYIFMKIAAQEIRSAVPPFDLEYATRENSAVFLKSLSDESDLAREKERNIDFFHICSAYETINGWFDEQTDKSVAIQKLNTKFRENVFFIWYEMPNDSDPTAMFTKVNLGKIPLTNAELIKALLLNKDNFSADIDKQQLEISIAWDRIEQGLRDDSFWYFLNEKDQSGTRIDLLFELLALEYNHKLSTPIPDAQKQKYFPFLVFSANLNAKSDKKEKETFVKDLWDEVEKLYAEFRDWYFDLDKYHIIGYLIATGVNITEVSALTSGKRKNTVTKDLLARARKTIPGGIDKDTLSNISYGNDNPKIRKLLLLFNVATLVCKSEKQYRFPFYIYKGEASDRNKWDIEHIHATGDETGKGEADDGIGNLTLLDAQTNRSYKNAPFEEKHRIIIEREKNGLFVPLCTKNAFLKVYSAGKRSNMNMTVWEDEDKKNYRAEMEETIKSFLDGSFQK